MHSPGLIFRLYYKLKNMVSSNYCKIEFYLFMDILKLQCTLAR